MDSYDVDPDDTSRGHDVVIGYCGGIALPKIQVVHLEPWLLDISGTT